MQNTSVLFKKLLADPAHVKETKIKIAGAEYGEDEIMSLAIFGTTFPDMVVGNCFSHEIDLTVESAVMPPRMAKISLLSRLTVGEEASEWWPDGVFYTDTKAFSNGLLIIHGFDAMLKAEEAWLDPSEDAGDWPMPQPAAVNGIASRMGVAVDPRTKISRNYAVEYPNDLSMAEVLGYVAVCNCGNWSMTGSGELLLTPLGLLPQETRFLVDDEDGGAILFGSVRILV